MITAMSQLSAKLSVLFSSGWWRNLLVRFNLNGRTLESSSGQDISVKESARAHWLMKMGRKTTVAPGQEEWAVILQMLRSCRSSDGTAGEGRLQIFLDWPQDRRSGNLISAGGLRSLTQSHLHANVIKKAVEVRKVSKQKGLMKLFCKEPNSLSQNSLDQAVQQIHSESLKKNSSDGEYRILLNFLVIFM